MNKFRGTVLFRSRPTVERSPRQFTADATFSRTLGTVPVYTLDDPVRGLTEVGRVTVLDDNPDGLTVSGITSLPPGDYPCGADVDDLHVLIPDGDPVAVLLGLDPDYVEQYTACRLRRLTVYLGDDAESKPAWPGTHITVTEGDTDR